METSVCGLLMPSNAREAFFALRAFNVEIATIKDASRLVGGRSRGGLQRSSPAAAGGTNYDDNRMDEGVGDSSIGSRLRMQWWRDAIAEIYETADSDKQHHEQQKQSQDSILHSLTSSRKHNPTLRSLAHAINAHGLTHRFLRRIMEAREVDLDIVQYERVRDIAQYGEDTVSSVLYLSLECAGVSEVGRLNCTCVCFLAAAQPNFQLCNQLSLSNDDDTNTNTTTNIKIRYGTKHLTWLLLISALP